MDNNPKMLSSTVEACARKSSFLFLFCLLGMNGVSAELMSRALNVVEQATRFSIVPFLPKSRSLRASIISFESGDIDKMISTRKTSVRSSQPTFVFGVILPATLFILTTQIYDVSGGSCRESKLCCPGRDSSCVVQKAPINAIIEDLSDKPCYCDHACLKLGD